MRRKARVADTIYQKKNIWYTLPLRNMRVLTNYAIICIWVGKILQYEMYCMTHQRLHILNRQQQNSYVATCFLHVKWFVYSKTVNCTGTSLISSILLTLSDLIVPQILIIVLIAEDLSTLQPCTFMTMPFWYINVYLLCWGGCLDVRNVSQRGFNAEL